VSAEDAAEELAEDQAGEAPGHGTACQATDAGQPSGTVSAAEWMLTVSVL
jgi:hypothetical protein